jgi:hypothetical protein
MKMHSKLFSRFDPKEEQNKLFAGHLRSLLDIPETTRKTCIGNLAKVMLSETETEEEAITEALVGQTGLTHIELNNIHNVLRFFALRLIRVREEETLKGDDPEKWGTDLCGLELITESERPTFVEAMRMVEDTVLPSLQEERRRRLYTTGVFPHLRSLGTTVELRAVQQDEYDWSKNVEDYHPQFKGLTPVGSIHVGLRKADPEDFYFQVDEGDLDRIIKSLIALKKDMEELKRHIPQSGFGKEVEKKS